MSDASALIDEWLASLPDRRGEALARLRGIIRAAIVNSHASKPARRLSKEAAAT